MYSVSLGIQGDVLGVGAGHHGAQRQGGPHRAPDAPTQAHRALVHVCARARLRGGRGPVDQRGGRRAPLQPARVPAAPAQAPAPTLALAQVQAALRASAARVLPERDRRPAVAGAAQVRPRDDEGQALRPGRASRLLPPENVLLRLP